MMWFILLAVLVADQMTKGFASREGWVSLNQGVSFGLLSSVPSVWLNLSLLMLIGFSWLIYRRAWQKMPVAAGFFLGGALSNILDRLMWSGVRDWLPIPGTTVHNNLADYGILAGLGLLIWHSLSHQLPQWSAKHSHTSTAPAPELDQEQNSEKP